MKGLTLLSSLILFLAPSVYSQVCLSGNCSSGYGKFQYANGDIYEGEFYDDKREGFGVYTWKSGDKYKGESMGNEFNGFGVMIFADGTKYVGDFKNGEFDGEGEKTFKGGTKLTGIFEKGKYLGKISYYGKPIGTTGCLNGNCESGYGMKYYSGNDRFFGYFLNGKRQGFGAYYWEDGTRWVGEFDQNLLTGYGTYYFITGEKYVGSFSDSKRNGWGINYDPETGVKKIGFWEKDKLVTPKSSLVPSNGQATGCIEGDCKNGFGKFIYTNGYYEGNFKNGYRNGYGKYYFDIGDYYVGNFKDNKFNGKGMFFYTNGERYSGEWKEQRYHGYGQLFHFDGLPEEGYWSEGKFMGKDQKPANYETWVKSNYTNNNTMGTIASNIYNKPNAGTSTKPTGSTTGTNTKPTGTKPPPSSTKPTGSVAGNNTNTKPTNQNTNTKPTTTNTKPSGGGFSLVDKEYVQKGLALVIGNSKYRYITKLNNPSNDVIAVSNQLKANGFDVITVYDGDRDAMIEAFMKFGERLKDYDVGLFYYSGHGVKYGSENYMVPVSANIRTPEDVSLSCLGLSNILNRMGKAFTKLNIVIVDACRTPFKDGRGSNDDFDPEPNLNSKTLPDETGIYFATSDGTPASDGQPGTNGVYTSELVKYLKYMCQGNVEIEDIFKRVLREVKNKSNKIQVPEAKSSITKDFYYQCKQ